MTNTESDVIKYFNKKFNTEFQPVLAIGRERNICISDGSYKISIDAGFIESCGDNIGNSIDFFLKNIKFDVSIHLIECALYEFKGERVKHDDETKQYKRSLTIIEK